MKKVVKIIGITAGAILGIAVLVLVGFIIKWNLETKNNLAKLGDEAPRLTESGISYRDLNKNGKLDPYEDKRLTLDKRVNDLMARMTMEEKAGLMYINIIGMNKDGSTMEKPALSDDFFTLMLSTFIRTSQMVGQKYMSHFNIVQNLPKEVLAKWNNNIQKMAERTRLGIPVTIATDPRHGPGENPGANVFTEDFSHWPTALGLAATGDSTLVKEFADIARQEYTAVGIRLSLSPMADLATEPRWGRINGTFGEDAELAARMARAYINGFQGDSITNTSVMCMSKHFAGGGPQKDGEDAHFPYGKDQVYPGNNFDYHLIPFEKGVFAANTAQIMPYYGIPVGQTSEDVGFAFNKEIITGMLRRQYGFDGVVCTDWNIINDTNFGEARKWGVEALTPLERTKKVLDAGCDQFGGESSPEYIIELVSSGQITESRIDESVRRLLEDKFELGLFDNPYVDIERATTLVGNQNFVDKGKEAQKKSTVLLKNDDLLPLDEGTKVYVENINKSIAEQYGSLVDSPEQADVIIIRLQTPYEKRNDYFIEQFFHQGRLHFSEERKKEILELISQKPSVVGISLERPAIIPDISDAASGLVADFGTEDDAFLDVVFGKFNPTGRLPFQMPSSLESVENQKEDVPFDLKDPLYPFGYGLGYESN
ncbi:MAG TPA: glycoside hydrolase family 3 N-terminal domain-containing protein [Cyclobacteriaceae bacterium]